MPGRLQDAWHYLWPEVWLPLEQYQEPPFDIYTSIYVELVKAFRVAPAAKDYDTIANDIALSRQALEATTFSQIRGEDSGARFLEDAFDVIGEAANVELPNEYRALVVKLLASRNLHYQLVSPFKLRPHMPGIFASLFSDVIESTKEDGMLKLAVADFEHAFQSLASSHSETDMKTCIHKASMLVEGIASACPGSQGKTLAELCDNIGCWPHSAVKNAVKNLYGFCSDYPGIRHAISPKGQMRPLDMRDSVIVPLLLLTAAGYFGQTSNLMATLRSPASEPQQIPAEDPVLDRSNSRVNLP